MTLDYVLGGALVALLLRGLARLARLVAVGLALAVLGLVLDLGFRVLLARLFGR